MKETSVGVRQALDRLSGEKSTKKHNLSHIEGILLGLPEAIRPSMYMHKG